MLRDDRASGMETRPNSLLFLVLKGSFYHTFCEAFLMIIVLHASESFLMWRLWVIFIGSLWLLDNTFYYVAPCCYVFFINKLSCNSNMDVYKASYGFYTLHSWEPLRLRKLKLILVDNHKMHVLSNSKADLVNALMFNMFLQKLSHY